jgi:predicted phage tail protein
MRKVILLGTLGDKYGSNWEMEADTYQEIFSCIEANYPSFRKTLIDIAEAGGDLDIQSGDKFLEVEEMFYPVDSDTIIITPIPAGAKSGSAKIMAAIAIVALAFILSPVLGPGGIYAAAAAGKVGATYFAVTAAFLLAANLAITGIMQLLAPDPSVDNDDKDYLFAGPENTIAEGSVVPVLFGEMIVGGVTISSGVGASYGPSVHVGFGSGLPLINLGGSGVQFPFISFPSTGITNISPFSPPTPNLTDNPITTPIPFVVDSPYPAYDGTEAR